MLIPFILFKILVRADIVGRNGIDGIETIYSLTFCHATLPGPPKRTRSVRRCAS